MPGARSPYYLLAVTLVVMLAMLSLTIGAAVKIHDLNRQIQSDNVLATLDGTARLLDTWQRQYIRSLPLLTEDPTVQQRVAALIAAHTRSEVPSGSDMLSFAALFAPRYTGMGYRGYSLVAPDLSLLASSVAGVEQHHLKNPVLIEQAQRALRDNQPILRPLILGTSRAPNARQPSSALSFMLCAPIEPTPMLRAVLCLHIDASDFFIEALSATRVGNTGETYVVDRDGRILSPSRFIKTPSSAKPQQPSASRPSLWARTPPRGAVPLTLATVDERYPLTAVAAKLMRDGTTGFLENYPDYRGVPVIGAGRWIDSLDIGLIVEQDLAEAYSAHRAARAVMVGLSAMEIFLVAALAGIFMRGRRDLAVREARIRHLLTHIPALVFLKDEHGRLQLLNPTFAAETGINGARSMGKALDEVLPPAWAALFARRDDAAVLRGKIFDQIIELPPALQTETRRFFRIVRFPVYNDDSASAQSIGTIATNVTELWRYRMELETFNRDLERIVTERTAQYLRAQHDAEAATRAKSEFLANMSHEIRTPLNAIIGLSYLSLNEAQTPKEKHYLQQIHRAGEHLLDTVNSILDFSKIEAGRLSIDNRPFSLQQLVDSVVGLIWQHADNKGLEVLVEIDPQMPANLNGDSLRIGQILINLCSNAVKFTDAGEITLRIEPLRRHDDVIDVRFTVSDTGIGIAPDQLQTLFQPFHQIDSSSTRRYEGTGLGLVISKSLTELLGGSISVQSTPGAGTRFTIEIPLHVAPSSAAPHDSAEQKPTLQAQSVLVIDDNTHARQLLAGVLRSLNFQVSEAESGNLALELIRKTAAAGEPFKLIFIDWKMPELSGAETARQISELDNLGRQGEQIAPAQLILVAPHHSVHELDIDNTGIFSAILRKPITPSAVFDTIAPLLLPDYHAALRHPPTEPLTLPVDISGAHVLLVEDNEINQEVAIAILRSLRVEVTVASNGIEAIECVRTHHFDAVLMDVQMPLLDGYAATRSIRADTHIAQPPIIAMTANAMQGDRDACLAAGMNDYIAKPIRPAELLQTLSRWVHKK